MDVVTDFGRYKIINTIGRGSVAIVYKAKDTRLERLVALKVFRVSSLKYDIDADRLIQLFKKEVKLASSLIYDRIIRIYDAGVMSDGSPFIAMEYVEGMSLDTLIAENKIDTIEKALNILMQIAGAIDYAHKQGVIHRDIKPANILIDKNYKSYLLDFGISTFSSQSLTPTREIVGSPSYMSPEQLRGELLDVRSDLFSLAILAFELIKGKKPFLGADLTELITNIVNGKIVDTESALDVSSEVDRILFKALSTIKEERYNSASEFVRELCNICNIIYSPEGSLIKGEIVFAYNVNDSSHIAKKLEKPNLDSDFISSKKSSDSLNLSKIIKSNKDISFFNETTNLDQKNNLKRNNLNKSFSSFDEKDSLHLRDLIREFLKRKSIRKVYLPAIGFFIATFFGMTFARFLSTKNYDRNVEVVPEQNKYEDINQSLTSDNLDSQFGVEKSKDSNSHKNQEQSTNNFENSESSELFDEIVNLSNDSSNESTTKLIELAYHQNYKVKIQALKALSSESHSAKTIVVKLLKRKIYDEDYIVRGYAVKFLGKIGDRDSLTLLSDLARKETNKEILAIILKARQEIVSRLLQ